MNESKKISNWEEEIEGMIAAYVGAIAISVSMAGGVISKGTIKIRDEFIEKVLSRISSLLTEREAQVRELCIGGLLTDGAHHKDWYLEEIIKSMGFDIEKIREEEKKKGYEWESGIAP